MKKLLFPLVMLVFIGLSAKATIYSVSVADYSFTPSTLNIHNGDTVKWVWVSGSHTTTSTSVPSGAASWNNPINSSSTQFEIQLTVLGTYQYECTVHPSMMTGTINVTPAAGLTNYGNNSNAVNAYPTPFSDKLSISFTLPETGAINISIYDLTGKLVRVLADKDFEKGSHIIIWDGKNENGETVNNGLYFYMIESKGIIKTSGKIVFNS